MQGIQTRVIEYPLAKIDELVALPYVADENKTPQAANQLTTKDYTDIAIANAVAGIKYIPVRQCVLSGPLDASKQPAHLGTGTGLVPQLLGGTTNVRLAFGAGFSSTGQVDYIENITANTDFATLPANQTNYLYAQRVSAGTVSLLSSLVPFQHGPSFDTNRHSLLDFDGANAATSVTDAFGHSWVFVGNAQLTTTTPILGSSSLLLDGTGDCIYTTAFPSLLNGPFTIEFTVRFAALPSSGNSVGLIYGSNGGGFGFKIDLFNNAGTTRINIDMSSNGSTNGIASSQNGSKTTWSTGTDYKFAITWDGTTYRYFVDGVVDYSTANSNAICPITNLILGAKTTGGSGSVNGRYDNWRMTLGAALYVTTYTAPTTQLTGNAWWYDTANHKMFFGTNAAWVETPALYLGRAITGASSVSSVAPVPYLDEYDSDWFDISASTSYTKTHNYGHDLYNIETQGRNKKYPNDAKQLGFDGTNGAYNTHKGPNNIITRVATLSTSADYTRLYSEGNTSRTVAIDQMRNILRRSF